MEFEKGTALELVIGDDINWAKEGDKLIFIRKSKKYDADKGLMVIASDDSTHFINEYRVAPFGDDKAIAKCKANAPKFYVVLQDSCRNVQTDRAIVGLDKALEVAKDSVSQGEPQTVYELKAVNKIAKEPIVSAA